MFLSLKFAVIDGFCCTAVSYPFMIDYFVTIKFQNLMFNDIDKTSSSLIFQFELSKSLFLYIS